MEQVGGWGEVMNATVPTKGGKILPGSLRFKTRLRRPSCRAEENAGSVCSG